MQVVNQSERDRSEQDRLTEQSEPIPNSMRESQMEAKQRAKKICIVTLIILIVLIMLTVMSIMIKQDLSVQNKLSEIEKNLSDAQANLLVAQEELNATKILLNDTIHTLVATQAILNETQKKLTDTETALNKTQASLASAADELIQNEFFKPPIFVDGNATHQPHLNSSKIWQDEGPLFLQQLQDYGILLKNESIEVQLQQISILDQIDAYFFASKGSGRIFYDGGEIFEGQFSDEGGNQHGWGRLINGSASDPYILYSWFHNMKPYGYGQKIYHLLDAENNKRTETRLYFQNQTFQTYQVDSFIQNQNEFWRQNLSMQYPIEFMTQFNQSTFLYAYQYENNLNSCVDYFTLNSASGNCSQDSCRMQLFKNGTCPSLVLQNAAYEVLMKNRTDLIPTNFTAQSLYKEQFENFTNVGNNSFYWLVYGVPIYGNIQLRMTSTGGMFNINYTYYLGFTNQNYFDQINILLEGKDPMNLNWDDEYGVLAKYLNGIGFALLSNGLDIEIFQGQIGDGEGNGLTLYTSADDSYLQQYIGFQHMEITMYHSTGMSKTTKLNTGDISQFQGEYKSDQNVYDKPDVEKTITLESGGFYIIDDDSY